MGNRHCRCNVSFERIYSDCKQICLYMPKNTVFSGDPAIREIPRKIYPNEESFSPCRCPFDGESLLQFIYIKLFE